MRKSFKDELGKLGLFRGQLFGAFDYLSRKCVSATSVETMRLCADVLLGYVTGHSAADYLPLFEKTASHLLDHFERLDPGMLSGSKRSFDSSFCRCAASFPTRFRAVCSN